VQYAEPGCIFDERLGYVFDAANLFDAEIGCVFVRITDTPRMLRAECMCSAGMFECMRNVPHVCVYVWFENAQTMAEAL
jgi:hypothetical protein